MPYMNSCGELLQITSKNVSSLNPEELFDMFDDIDQMDYELEADMDVMDMEELVEIDENSSLNNVITNLLSLDINTISNDVFEGYILFKDNYYVETKVIKMVECETCGLSEHIVDEHDGGVKVCSVCGVIASILFDHSLETNSFDGETNNRRCNAITNIFLPQSSIAVSIGGNNMILKARHGWSSMPYNERSLNKEFKKIHACCVKGKIVKCIEDDVKISYFNIKKIKLQNGKAKIIRGINRKRLRAGCIFKACQKNNCTKSKNDIAKLLNIDKKDVTKGCKMFESYMQKTTMPYKAITPSADQYIASFCKSINHRELIEKCLNVANNITKLNVASKHTPISVAGACILLVCNMENIELDKKMACKAFDISEITLIKTFRKIVYYQNIIISKENTNKVMNIIDNYRTNIVLPELLHNKLMKIKKDILMNEANKDVVKPKNTQQVITQNTENNIEILYNFPTIKTYANQLLRINKKLNNNIEKFKL